MKTRVQRWGNSLALRIPKTFAEEISVQAGDSVDMSIARGRLLIATCATQDYQLARLVAKIRPGNLHKEIITAQPQGREVW